MTLAPEGQWPHYTYAVPQTYTKSQVRLVGLGNYSPKGIITNEFFAYISTCLGDPRKAEDLERVTGLALVMSAPVQWLCADGWLAMMLLA